MTTEVLKTVIEYCQKEKDIHRLEAFVEEGNIASSKVLEKLGFVYEGTMKECEIKNGKYISLSDLCLIKQKLKGKNADHNLLLKFEI